MRLTVLSDYSLRVLMYLAAQPDRLSTIQEIASAYAISENHLMKVVHRLGKSGLVETVRGRGGGMRLARPADKIKIGAVLRMVEDDQALVQCFSDDDTCRITEVCRLKRVLSRAPCRPITPSWTAGRLPTSLPGPRCCSMRWRQRQREAECR